MFAVDALGKPADDRIQLIQDAQLGPAVNFSMLGTDSCYSGRTELQQGNPPPSGSKVDRRFHVGDDVWIGFRAVFPLDYPLNSSLISDGGLMQIHVAGSGKSPYGMSVGRGSGSPACCNGPGSPHPGGPELGYLEAAIESGGTFTAYDIYKSIHAGTVYRFLTHYKAAEDSSGLVEQYLGEGTATPTLVFARTGFQSFYKGPDFATLGLYPDTARGVGVGPMNLLVGGYTVATTREAAEASAFG
jgi:hypothetical protein